MLQKYKMYIYSFHFLKFTTLNCLRLQKQFDRILLFVANLILEIYKSNVDVFLQS